MSSRHRLLRFWAGLVCDRPKLVLILALLGAVAAVGVTWRMLGFQPDRNALVSEDLDWNRRYINFVSHFEGNDDMTVVVERPEGEGGAELAQRFVDDLAARLKNDPNVTHVFHGYDTSRTSEAAIRLLDWKGFTEQLEMIGMAGPILQADSLGDLVNLLGRSMADPQAQDPARLAPMVQFGQEFLAVLREAVRTGQTADAFDELQIDGGGWMYLTTENGKLYYLVAAPRKNEGDLDSFAAASAAIRGHIAESKKVVPGVESGLTGVTALEAEETSVTTRDSTVSSILAVAAISVLLITAFHSWKVPLLAVAALLIGIAWTFGYLTLAIGHLQVLSVVFTVILLGLGIDVGIHLISRFEMLRYHYADGPVGFKGAMQETLACSGPGIMTGAVTTAAAFCTTMLTDFQGMAEMGHIAAMGMLLCLLAMLAVFPAILRLAAPTYAHITPLDERLFTMRGLRWVEPMVRRSRAVVVASVLLIILAGVGLTHITYNYNLMAIQAPHMDSVVWQSKILEHEKSVWYAVSIAKSPEEARRLTEAFRRLKVVDKVGGAGMLFPDDDERKLHAIRAARGRLGAALPAPPEPITPGRESASELAERFSAMSQMVAVRQAAWLSQATPLGRVLTAPWSVGWREPAIDPRAMARLSVALEAVAAELRKLPGATGDARVAELNGSFIPWRERLRGRVERALADRPLSVADLPEIVAREAVGRVHSDWYQLKIHPNRNVWRPAELEPFVTGLRSVDADATGSPFQVYESGKLIVRSYQMAGIYALAAVFILVWVDFRKVTDALLCMLPVTVGFATLLGLMGWVDWMMNLGAESDAEHPWSVIFQLNPANIIVLPLLFGIGVDVGVHIMHRYRVDPTEFPPGLAKGTGKGIILTSLTTMIGFASMMLSDHRGIRSLGFALALGIGLTLVIALTVMPTILQLRNEHRARSKAK